MKNRYKAVAVTLALRSGKLILASVGKIAKVSYKGKHNIVTDVDKKSEQIIKGGLMKAFPSHSIVAEETGLTKGHSSYRWLVDPLDGTTNFAHSFPFFCVSIGLEYNNDMILGVVYDPVREELFTAEKGRGAYLNGRRIKASRINRLSQGLLVTGFSYDPKEKIGNVRHFKKFLSRSMAVRRVGSAALDLCYVACGRFDGYWEFGLHPWDSAAGSLIVEEAGGCVTSISGSRYYPENRTILASNRFLHQKMISIICR